MSLRIGFVATDQDVVWKVVRSGDSSPFWTHIWRRGRNHSSRPGVALTDHERAADRVDNGFHVFLHAREALWATTEALWATTVQDIDPGTGTLAYMFTAGGNMTVLALRVQPEHLVAAGHWLQQGHKLESAVYTEVINLGPWTGNA